MRLRQTFQILPCRTRSHSRCMPPTSKALVSASSDETLKEDRYPSTNATGSPTPSNSNAVPSLTAPFAQQSADQLRYNLSEESWKHHAQARAILSNLIGPNGEQLTSSDPYNTTVFVGGLSPLISEETLRTFFAPFGEIHYVGLLSNSRIRWMLTVRGSLCSGQGSCWQALRVRAVCAEGRCCERHREDAGVPCRRDSDPLELGPQSVYVNECALERFVASRRCHRQIRSCRCSGRPKRGT